MLANSTAKAAASSAAAALGSDTAAALANDAADLLMEAVTAAAIQAGARRKGPRSTSGRARRSVSHAPWFDVDCCAARRSYWSARRRASTAACFRQEERRFKSLARLKRRR